MNKVHLIGRLTADVNIIATLSGKDKGTFSLAVPRKVKGEVDFIPCYVWEDKATILERYTQKGSKIAVTGSLRVTTYEKNGYKQTYTAVAVDDFEFLDSKKEEENKPIVPSSEVLTREEDDLMEIPF